MKYAKILILTTICLLIMSSTISGYKESEILEQVVKYIGMQVEIIDIVDWSIINRDFMEFNQMKDINTRVLKNFLVEEQSFKDKKEFSKTHRILTSEGKIDTKTYMQVISQSIKLPEQYEKKPQTYLVISVNTTDINRLTELKGKVIDSIRLFGGQSKVTTCITGSFDGKLNKMQREEVVGKIKKCLKVKNAQIIHDESTTSLLGYSPLLGESIEVMDKCYNLDVAIRYSEFDDKTFVWIGTPVISVEY